MSGAGGSARLLRTTSRITGSESELACSSSLGQLKMTQATNAWCMLHEIRFELLNGKEHTLSH